MIVLISFTYACLNLPYFILWLIYYHDEMLNKEYTSNSSSNSHLRKALQIAESFYLLNFVLNFYIYALSGSLFRGQVKYSGLFFFLFYDLIQFLFLSVAMIELLFF